MIKLNKYINTRRIYVRVPSWLLPWRPVVLLQLEEVLHEPLNCMSVAAHIDVQWGSFELRVVEFLSEVAFSIKFRCGENRVNRWTEF